MPVGGADLGAESALELDLVVDAHLMAYQVALSEIAFAAGLATVVANVAMDQVHVILRRRTGKKDGVITVINWTVSHET